MNSDYQKAKENASQIHCKGDANVVYEAWLNGADWGYNYRDNQIDISSVSGFECGLATGRDEAKVLVDCLLSVRKNVSFGGDANMKAALNKINLALEIYKKFGDKDD